MRWDGCIAHIAVVELTLWMLFLAKYNSGGKAVRCIIRNTAGNLRQHQAGVPVGFEMVKSCFRRKHVILAILSNLVPHILCYRLIPRKSQLLMMNPKLDLEFLQALFVCCRSKVVNIRVGDVICLTKQIAVVVVIDDAGRQLENFHRTVTEHGCVENMVVVPAVIEADQLIAEQFFDLAWFRIYHPDTGMPRTLNFPDDQEKVREHLNVKEYNWIVLVECDRICRVF